MKVELRLEHYLWKQLWYQNIKTIRHSLYLCAYPREKVQYLEISLKNSPDGPILPDNASIIVESGEFNYRTKHSSGPLFKYALINNDLVENDGVLLYCGPSAEELRNPKQEDINETNILIRYLNDN